MSSQGNDCDKIRSGGQNVEQIERAMSNPDQKDVSISFSAMSNVASTKSTSDRKVVVPKPVRPLTAYHLFFQLEREYIIQTSRRDESQSKTDYRPIGREIDDEMPYRYRYIHLSPHWYASGSGKRLQGSSNQAQKKRKHRKTHGIGFLELSKMISSKWAQLEHYDMEIKNYVSKIASRELAVYRRNMEWYKSKVDPNFRQKRDSTASIDSDESLNSQGTSPKPPVSLDLTATRLNKVAPERVTGPVAKVQSNTMNNPCKVRKPAANESSLEEFTFHPVPSSQMPDSYRRMSRHTASAPPIRHSFIDSYGHNRGDMRSGSLSPIPILGQLNPLGTFLDNEQYQGTMINESRNQFPFNYGRTEGYVGKFDFQNIERKYKSSSYQSISAGDVLPSVKRCVKRRNSSSPYQRRDMMRTISDFGAGVDRVIRSQPFEEDVAATEMVFTLDDAMDLMKALAD